MADREDCSSVSVVAASIRALQTDGTELLTTPARRAASSTYVPGADAERSERRKGRLRDDRDQPRNENVAGVDDDRKAVMKSEGLGVTPVTDPAVVATLTGAEDAP
jgi:hypothetical protein